MAALDGEWMAGLCRARAGVLALRDKYPSETLLLSAATQLDYLIALADGKESDDSALEEIDLGHLAAYPLADVLSYDLSVALCDIAERIRRDLRRQGRNPRLA